MKEQQYTKGEWKLVQRESGSLIIECGIKIIGQTSRASTPEEAKEIQANAQLISAAPDMYEELCQVRDMFNRVEAVRRLQGFEKVRRAKTLRVLAKAEEK